jgi:hypothetical protein
MIFLILLSLWEIKLSIPIASNHAACTCLVIEVCQL